MPDSASASAARSHRDTDSHGVESPSSHSLVCWFLRDSVAITDRLATALPDPVKRSSGSSPARNSPEMFGSRMVGLPWLVLETPTVQHYAHTAQPIRRTKPAT